MPSGSYVTTGEAIWRMRNAELQSLAVGHAYISLPAHEVIGLVEHCGMDLYGPASRHAVSKPTSDDTAPNATALRPMLNSILKSAEYILNNTHGRMVYIEMEARDIIAQVKAYLRREGGGG